MIFTQFQKNLLSETKRLLDILREEYSIEEISGNKNWMGNYYRVNIRGGDIEVYIYEDDAGVYDNRKYSKREYKYDNYEGHREKEISINTIGALKHVLANNKKNDDEIYFQKPQPSIQLWPLRFPWSRKE